MVEALTQVRAHGVPLSLVAIALTALIVALTVFYVYNDWTLVAVALLLLMVLALLLRTIAVIDSFKPRRRKSSLK
jgi:purine-cytosine permease-like protein